MNLFLQVIFVTCSLEAYIYVIYLYILNRTVLEVDL